MVRWSEDRDEYLARVSPRGGAAFLFLMSFVLAVGAISLIATGDACAGVVMLAFSWMLAGFGWNLVRTEHWILVPLRGRRVRWAGLGRRTREADVVRFDIDGNALVFAVLDDGRRELAVGSETFLIPSDAELLVQHLNELLAAGASRGPE